MRRLSCVGLMAMCLWAGSAWAEEEAPKASGPLLNWNLNGFALQLPVVINADATAVSGFPVDANGGTQPAGVAINPLARIALRFNSARVWPSFNLHLEVEGDLINGTYDARTSTPEGLGMPNRAGLSPQLRQGFARVIIGKAVIVEAGLMTSHWGLGLVANDGAHGWKPGSADFNNTHGGDRVLRALVSSVPLTDLGLMAAVGVDRVWDDDALLTAEEQAKGSGLGGDTAYQALVALTLGYEKPWKAGVYAVGRLQTTTDGRQLNVIVVDATGETRVKLGEKTALELGAEAAYVGGETDVAATPGRKTRPSVSQFGAVAKAGIDFGSVGGVLDILYASGDQNLYDGSQNAFNANSSYEMGLFLFQDVLAGQTGRTVNQTSNPNLVGKTPTGLERFPTRGAITNTLAFFPRAWGRPVAGLEIYGGPLFALAAVPPQDPYNALFIGGGEARNALNGAPGTYLGTELDLGVRYRAAFAGTTLTLGLEGGALLPGSAFNTDQNKPMGSVYGGRFLVDYRL